VRGKERGEGETLIIFNYVHGAENFLQNSQLHRNSPPTMKPEGSLPSHPTDVITLIICNK
jgi:hypothetical protein